GAYRGHPAGRRVPPARRGRAAVGEPQVAVGAGRDPRRKARAGVLQALAELGDLTVRRDPPDRRCAARVGEPEVAVRAGDDVLEAPAVAPLEAGAELRDLAPACA